MAPGSDSPIEDGRALRRRDELRANLLRFTDRAFGMLPVQEAPRILDLGCGTGVPTLRLAEISGGWVVGLDNDRDALGVLKEEAEARGLSDRVETRLGSVEHVPFPEGSFDVIWCEGAVAVLGFRRSLRSWRRLLNVGGSMVLHDEAGDVEEKLKIAAGEGFRILGHFEIPAHVWGGEFFGPAEGDPALEAEVQEFRLHPDRCRSAFFVVQPRRG